VLTMNSVKILHAVRSAITAIAELLVNVGQWPQAPCVMSPICSGFINSLLFVLIVSV